MTDFQVGDRAHMKLLPPGVADVTITGIGVCDDPEDSDACGKPTVTFLDPQSGEPDEGHADDFEKV